MFVNYGSRLCLDNPADSIPVVKGLLLMMKSSVNSDRDNKNVTITIGHGHGHGAKEIKNLTYDTIFSQQDVHLHPLEVIFSCKIAHSRAFCLF